MMILCASSTETVFNNYFTQVSQNMRSEENSPQDNSEKNSRYLAETWDLVPRQAPDKRLKAAVT